VTYRNSMLTVTLMGGLLGHVLGQSNRNPMPEPKFSELSKDDAAQLEQQRAVVAAAAKRSGTASLIGTKSDLPVLRRLIDDKVFKKSQTYELQCLGVAFGDVLTSELPLRWMMVTDEYGTDPTLRFKKTTVQINALTMISKRIERDEHVDSLGTSADDPRAACTDRPDHALNPFRRESRVVVDVSRRFRSLRGFERYRDVTTVGEHGGLGYISCRAD